MTVSTAWTIILVGLVACNRADHGAPSGGDAAVAKRPVAAASPAAVASPAASPSKARPDAAADNAPMVPLAGGKRLRLEGVGGTDPDTPGDGPPSLEITVPPKFALKMHSSDDELPSAHLKGGGLELVVQAPEAGFATLSETEASLRSADPKATFVHGDETPDGHVLVYRAAVPGIGPRFGVVVSRPRLKVNCGANALAHLSDAERVAAICLTLRAAPDAPPI